MRNQQYLTLAAFYLLVIMPVISQSAFDIQGHRGSRGLMPENTIPAFLKAVELGVSTIEMDVVVSMDGQIVVSHEPWMSSVICTRPDGQPVTKKEAKNFNFYQMKYAEIQSFDCGMRLDPDFPNQQKINAVKPTLKMVVKSVQRFAADNKYKTPSFNIELKTSPELYDIFTPPPQVFVELVVNEIRRLGIEEQSIIQSFDTNILEELNKVSDRKYKIGYVVLKNKKHDKNLERLSFKPDIYCPHFQLLNETVVKQLHDSNIKVLPWPVNEKTDMDRMLLLGVDGIVTDYPDLIRGI